MRRLLKRLLCWLLNIDADRLEGVDPDRLIPDAPQPNPVEQFFYHVNITVNNVQNSTHISGGVVGALNVNGSQVVNSISIKIRELTNNPESRDVANAFQELMEAITSELNPLTEPQRGEALQQVEYLAQQASAPANQRSAGMVSAAMNALANTCEAAGGLATAWQIFGPTISGFFGM